jgi:hypothetical protein
MFHVHYFSKHSRNFIIVQYPIPRKAFGNHHEGWKEKEKTMQGAVSPAQDRERKVPGEELSGWGQLELVALLESSRHSASKAGVEKHSGQPQGLTSCTYYPSLMSLFMALSLKHCHL